MLRTELNLGSVIGRGYFGEVYEATDPINGPVAVKVFRKVVSESDADWLKRKSKLLHEGQHLKEATHENVVKVLHIAEDELGDEIYLVMEFCENGSLDNQYKNGPVPLVELRALLTDVAFGLQAIHARGMLHRDIKPANILLSAEGRAKIADFGHVTDDIQFGYADAIGYIDHFAPEVFIQPLCSVKTDVWAFGMTVYRLLNGKAFYDKLPQPRYVVDQGNYAKKLPWLPHIPDAWRRFVRKALHDDPESRFQNFGEILHQLKRLPVEASWDCQYTEPRVSWSRVKKHRKIIVEWIRHSPRKHEWSAKSLPLNSGHERKLGSSNGFLSKAEAEKQLKLFSRNNLDINH